MDQLIEGVSWALTYWDSMTEEGLGSCGASAAIQVGLSCGWGMSLNFRLSTLPGETAAASFLVQRSCSLPTVYNPSSTLQPETSSSIPDLNMPLSCLSPFCHPVILG